jgi:hypothetical protein
MSCRNDNVIVNFKKFASVCEVGQNTFKVISKSLKKNLKDVIQDFINLKSVPGVDDYVGEIITVLEVALKSKATEIIVDALIRKSFFLFAYIYSTEFCCSSNVLYTLSSRNSILRIVELW